MFVRYAIWHARPKIETKSYPRGEERYATQSRCIGKQMTMTVSRVLVAIAVRVKLCQIMPPTFAAEKKAVCVFLKGIRIESGAWR